MAIIILSPRTSTPVKSSVESMKTLIHPAFAFNDNNYKVGISDDLFQWMFSSISGDNDLQIS